MTLPHYAAYKLAVVIGLGAGTLYAFIEKGTTSNVELALVAGSIAAIPPTITGVFTLVVQHRNTVKLDSVKKTGEATHDLSNSAMGAQLLAAIEDKQALSVVLHAVAKERGTPEALAAAQAQDVRVETAKKLYNEHQRNQAKVDAKHEMEAGN